MDMPKRRNCNGQIAGEATSANFKYGIAPRLDWPRPTQGDVSLDTSVSFSVLTAGGRQLVVLLPSRGKSSSDLGSKVRGRTGKPGHEYALTRSDIND